MGGGMVDKQLAEAAAGMHLKQFMPQSRTTNTRISDHPPNHTGL